MTVPTNHNEILLYLSILGLAFLVFMTVIYPRYFNKVKGPRVKAANYRPQTLLVDKKMPGIIGIIESRISHDNGTISLELRNKNGKFIRQYNNDQIVPLDTTQVLADSDAAVFITKESKYSSTEYSEDINDMEKKLQDAIKKSDYWQTQHQSLKANISSEVQLQIENIIKLQKQKGPDWEQKT